MASEAGEKPESGSKLVMATKPQSWVLPMLRLLAFSATASAALVMALNKQTKTFVVATIGNTPLKATLTAKFQHTPAFVFFVIVNGMASLHSLLMLAVDFIGPKYDIIGLRFLVIAILDMLNVALLSGGASAAAFMGQLGKNGNSHARWNKICDKFDTFCDHGGGAMIASFIGLALLMIITAISINKLKNQFNNCVVP
ncbi:unnamed protein product [Ilex paraguariensis]|uniref:CASP-like protein n=1 Tax=Ilex paraguariensis TaxID=185542 RepID=A0ABC8TDC0_9AQUA